MNTRFLPNMLRSSRKAVNLRQLDVAQKLGISSTDRISRWEKGQAEPNITNLFKLAKIYGKFPHELYPDLFDSLIPSHQICPNQDFCEIIEVNLMS